LWRDLVNKIRLELLAEDGVSCEPLSESNSLLTGKNTGKPTVFVGACFLKAANFVDVAVTFGKSEQGINSA
jgi:hypothetical protein